MTSALRVLVVDAPAVAHLARNLGHEVTEGESVAADGEVDFVLVGDRARRDALAATTSTPVHWIPREASESALVALLEMAATARTCASRVRAAEDWNRQVIATATEGVWVIDRDCCTVFASPRMAAMLGYSVEEMKGTWLFDFMAEGSGELAVPESDHRRGVAAEQHEFRFVGKDGRDVWALLSTSRLVDERGAYKGALALVTDITEQKRAEEALSATNALLSSVIDGTADAICLKDLNGRYLLANRAAAEMLGRADEAIVGKTDAELLPSAVAERIRTNDRIVISTARTCAFEEELCASGQNPGEVRTWLTTRDIYRDRHGEPIGLIAIARDITERKRAEEAQLRAQRDFRRVIEAVPDAILLRSGDHLVYANPAAVKMLGQESAQSLVGRPWHELFDPAAPLAQGTKGASTTQRITQPSGDVATIDLIEGPPIEFEGEPCVLYVGRDLTEKNKIEDRLARADRLVTVGTMVAGVAHEINNPLAFVLSNVDFAMEQLDRVRRGDAEAVLGQCAAALGDASKGAQRVRKIVQDLKVFSRSSGVIAGPADLISAIESAIALSFNQIRHHARLVRDLEPVPFVEIDESRLSQVIVNLLVNAAQAMAVGNADRNVLTVATRTTKTGDALLEVSDTGSGMSPEVQRRVFDPFFTTKPLGVGMGLGLSICHGIVTGAGGEIEVSSTMGQGTTFRVTLPRSEGQPPRSTPAGRGTSSPHLGRGKVLVIDDEQMIVDTLARVLGGGHDVVTETSPRAALERLRNGARFDVILCDLMMPIMSGMAFYAELCRVAPEQVKNMVFLTGGAFTTEAKTFLDECGLMHVEKPFDIKALRQMVDEQVTGNGGGR